MLPYLLQTCEAPGGDCINYSHLGAQAIHVQTFMSSDSATANYYLTGGPSHGEPTLFFSLCFVASNRVAKLPPVHFNGCNRQSSGSGRLRSLRGGNIQMLGQV